MEKCRTLRRDLIILRCAECQRGTNQKDSRVGRQPFRRIWAEAQRSLSDVADKEIALNFEVTNASQNGGTTAGGLERLPAHLKRRVDIFILELGINDAFRGVAVDEIRNNLQQIIDKVKARNPEVRVVIAGMQVPNYAVDDYVSAFGKMFADLAGKNGAALVPYLLDGVAGDPSLNLPDGIHPNAAGQKILAENVWRVLEPIAREVSQSKGGSPEPPTGRLTQKAFAS